MYNIELTGAINVIVGINISSPGLTKIDFKHKSNALVPEFKAIENLDLVKFEIFFSNSWTKLPLVDTHPLLIQDLT